jgi:DNA polymerase V
MSEIQILPAEFQEELKLHYAQAIKAGYPSSAGDYEDEFFDFNVSMVSDPISTFYGRVDTDQLIEEGIHPGDIAVINKAEEPKDGDLIVTFVNNEFVIRFLDLFHEKEGYILLQPANRRYSAIRVDDLEDFEVWGVVVLTIKKWK